MQMGFSLGGGCVPVCTQICSYVEVVGFYDMLRGVVVLFFTTYTTHYPVYPPCSCNLTWTQIERQNQWSMQCQCKIILSILLQFKFLFGTYEAILDVRGKADTVEPSCNTLHLFDRGWQLSVNNLLSTNTWDIVLKTPRDLLHPSHWVQSNRS